MKAFDLIKGRRKSCQDSVKSVSSTDPLQEDLDFGFLKKEENVTILRNTLDRGLIICKKGSKWGIVNDEGELVIPCIFDSIQSEYGIGRIIFRYKKLVFDCWLNEGCQFAFKTVEEVWSDYLDRDENGFMWKRDDMGSFFRGNINPRSYNRNADNMPSFISLKVPDASDLSNEENEDFIRLRSELFEIMDRTNGITLDELEVYHKNYLKAKGDSDNQ